MPPETGTALLILVAFVLPGFVALLISERTHTIRGEDTPFERLLQALYYSALTYGVLVLAAVVIGYDRRDLELLLREEQRLWKLLLAAALAVFVVPVAIAQLGRLWRRSRRVRPWMLERLGVSLSHRTPSGWDHFFQSGSRGLIRATMSDGRVVGGFYGPGSFAGYSEQAGDLFLEERWELDDDAWFLRPAKSSLGLWLSRESIISIEIYEPPAASPERQPLGSM